MSEDELLAAQGGAPKKKKKKKKKPKVDEYGNAITPNVDGEPVKKKKKKKKPKAEDEDAGNIVTKPGESDGPPVKKKKKKKKTAAATTSENGTTDLLDAGVTSDGHDGIGYAPVAVAASATSAFATRNTDDDSQDEKAIHRLSYNDDYDDAAVKQKVDDADVIVADTSPSQDAFYPNVDVDADVMAEVQQDGIVQVDASGGIQAFVAETIAVDGDDVGIIKSDAEIETEEKKRYTKYFLGAVACMVVVIAAVAVPLTLTYAKGRSATRFITVTEQPTDVPSLMPSLMPSSQPSSLRFRAIVSKLKPLSGDALNVPGSPQYNAAMWISDKDELNLDLSNGGFEQRYIMALFYYAMDGNNWNQKQGWLTGESECYWFGIDGNSRGCGDDGVGGCIARGDFVGDYDKICRLDMGRLNNLYGQLPSELGNLAEMRYFEIQDDYLYGTLPQTLGNWDKLHTFLVGGNFLSGGFPATFEGNEMLGTIFLDRNRFNTTFPNVFSTLKNLEWLDAEQNGFKGSLPASITSLKRLRILNLNDNSLTGHLPDEWDEDNLIEDFEVADNDFEGPLPHTLASARFLKDIHLSRNQLTGSLPTSYNNLGSLEELYLDGNQFTGELPQAATIYDGLQELSIHSNNFEGRFPTENFENTLRVKTLELHGNPLLTGVITDNICARRDPSLSYTRLLSLTAICDMIDCGCCDCYDFDGDLILIALPTRSPVQEVQTPTNLDETGEIIPQPTASPVTWSPISVGERKQSGITEQIEREVLQRGAVFFVMDDTDPRLKALHWILYSDKLQLGTQDANLNQRYVLAVMAFSLESVEWFNCGRHMNVGPNGMDNLFVNEDCIFDNYLTGQKEVFKIWLSSTDECEWFGVICSSDGVVRGLELIGNDLIGEIPPEISQLRFLQYLALSGNCLHGTIPAEFGTMSNLTSLELQGNGLSGEVPNEIYSASKLQLLNVAMQFQNAYTCKREDGSQVNTLYAGGDPANGYNWGLHGRILGPEVSTWRSMKGLHVFGNSFGGTIADEIGDLKYLVFLRAQNNVIAGMIPSPITRLSKLRELMLGKNEIYSDLPPDIGNMEDLEDLRVTENEMFGGIPTSLYQLKKLKKLWLEDTLYCEEIRDDKDELTGYDCDMSSEYGFDGPISSEIGNLSRLSHLIINNNPLTGTVPSEIGQCEALSVLHMHQTKITGTIPDDLCLLRDKNLNSESGTGILYADCRPNNRTEDPFVSCSCCSDCCDHTTQVCVADD